MLAFLALLTLHSIEHRPGGIQGNDALVTVLAKVENETDEPSTPATLTCISVGQKEGTNYPVDPIGPGAAQTKSFGIKIPARSTTVSTSCSLTGGGRGTISKTTVLARMGPLPTPNLALSKVEHEWVSGERGKDALEVKLSVTVINHGNASSTPQAGILCENTEATPRRVGAPLPGVIPKGKGTVTFTLKLPEGERGVQSTCTIQSEGTGTAGKRTTF